MPTLFSVRRARSAAGKLSEAHRELAPETSDRRRRRRRRRRGARTLVVVEVLGLDSTVPPSAPARATKLPTPSACVLISAAALRRPPLARRADGGGGDRGGGGARRRRADAVSESSRRTAAARRRATPRAAASSRPARRRVTRLASCRSARRWRVERRGDPQRNGLRRDPRRRRRRAVCVTAIDGGAGYFEPQLASRTRLLHTMRRLPPLVDASCSSPRRAPQFGAQAAALAVDEAPNPAGRATASRRRRVRRSTRS